MKTSIHLSLPEWAVATIHARIAYLGDNEQMRLTIELARQNVIQGTGGPFGAAIFERDSGRLVSVGVNSVERLNNSVIHAEVLALMLAEADTGTFSLHDDSLPEHVLVTSCEPCAMCRGAILWSGVRRVVCGAGREDALRIGFDEGPVFPQSYEYLRQRGMTIIRDVLAAEARTVIDLYRERGGLVYNG